MFSLDLPEEVLQAQLKLRELVQGEFRAAEAAVDRIPDPREAYASEVFRGALRRGYELGLPRLTLPTELGGGGHSLLAHMVFVEEFSAGAPGLGSHLQSGIIAANFIRLYKLQARLPVYKEYLEAFMHDNEGRHSGAWAITEPDLGSDMFSFDVPGVAFTTRAAEAADGGLRATKRGDEYSIGGRKSVFVSNGYLADFLLVMVSIHPEQGLEGSGAFLIPANLPGISRTDPVDKLGMRALNQAGLIFDDVRVPAEMLIVSPGPGYRKTFESIVTFGNTGVGMRAVGMARGAYDIALAYAKVRRQGGKRLIDHQLIKAKLFDAFRSIEAARALLLKSAWLLETRRQDLKLAMAGRVTACEMAMRVIPEMVQVLGGYGILRETGVEKLYRDIKMMCIADGTIERVTIYAADRL